VSRGGYKKRVCKMKKKIELLILLFCVSSAIQTALSIKVNNRTKELEKTVNAQSLRIDDLTKMAKLSAIQCSSEDGLIEAKVAELYALDDIDKSYNMKIDKIHNKLVELNQNFNIKYKVKR